MIITEEGIKRIRELLNEEIPEGGSDADTLFSDLSLGITLQGSESENHALYLLWTQKAGRIQKTAGDIKSIHAGGESVEHYTASDYVNLCLKTADGYRKAWEDEKKTKESASFMLLRKPEKGGDLW
ncbi:MAG: hypothetical protein P1P65_00860 [Treponema sp.]